MPPTEPKTDAEIVAEVNDLARKLYRSMGCVVEAGYRFDLASHPQELGCWNAAVIAYDHLTDHDVEGAVMNMDD